MLGEIRLTKPIDYETLDTTQLSHTLTITAQDMGSPAEATTATVTYTFGNYFPPTFIIFRPHLLFSAHIYYFPPTFIIFRPHLLFSALFIIFRPHLMGEENRNVLTELRFFPNSAKSSLYFSI